MEANIITLFRICLVFVTVGLLQINTLYVQGLAVIFIILVLYLDALDGYVARKLKVASDFGALFDITGDRIVENIFWIYFTYTDLLSFWVPMIVITRGFLSDTVRAVAFKGGQTPFGEKTMMKSRLTRFLVASRFSRGFYGMIKAVLFTYLGVFILLNTGISKHEWLINPHIMVFLEIIKDFLVFITVFMCIVRGLPVLWDGKEILLSKTYPRTADIINAKSRTV